jgi:FG-GAP-like repeat
LGSGRDEPHGYRLFLESRVDATLRGAGINNWDFAFFKTTNFGPENKLGLQFRTEFFNTFNRVQFGGLLDIFLVNSGKLTNPMHPPETFDRHDPRNWNRLYRQNQDGSFTDVTKEAGLADAGDGNYGMGVAVGDYDNDGFPDLYITNYGKNTLYRNNGDGTFTDVTAKAGVEAGGFFDYDNDGHLDLFVTRYMLWDTRGRLSKGSALPGVVGISTRFPLAPSLLLCRATLYYPGAEEQEWEASSMNPQFWIYWIGVVALGYIILLPGIIFLVMKRAQER